MKSSAEQIREFGDQILQETITLLRTHSSIRHLNLNSPSSPIVVIGIGDYAFNKLELEGERLRSKCLQNFNSFSELTENLLQDQTKAQLHQYKEAKNAIMHAIKQDKDLWDPTIEPILKRVLKSFNTIHTLVDQLYDASNGQVIFVPDTNALLINPDLESWNFPNVTAFEILLLPSVLKELDELKINHRNEDVRKKAIGIINRLKEYRRRGTLSEGVAILKDRITLRTEASEPNFEKTLHWLAKDNSDDRILAAFMEQARKCPRTNVILVTADINLQNKAEMARMPYCEPSEPINP